MSVSIPQMKAGLDVQTVAAFVGHVMGTGGPLVVLHGLAASSHYWSPVLPALAKTHRVIAPDLLGFGRAPKPERSHYDATAHVAYLHRVLPAVAGRPFDLVGHSAGALVALQYAAAHPDCVRRVALISLPLIGCQPWGHREDGSHRPLHRLIAHTRTGSRLATLGLHLVSPLGRLIAPRVQRDVPPAAARDALSVTAASYWRTLEAIVYGTDVPALLDRQPSRPLLLHGEHDRTAPFDEVQALRRSRPDLDLAVIAGAGHNPIISHGPQVMATLTRYLSLPA